jgi:hypothetical protein
MRALVGWQAPMRTSTGTRQAVKRNVTQEPQSLVSRKVNIGTSPLTLYGPLIECSGETLSLSAICTSLYRLNWPLLLL